jgi:hypothetical protein
MRTFRSSVDVFVMTASDHAEVTACAIATSGPVEASSDGKKDEETILFL